jgi:hypothetical protein
MLADEYRPLCIIFHIYDGFELFKKNANVFSHFLKWDSVVRLQKQLHAILVRKLPWPSFL